MSLFLYRPYSTFASPQYDKDRSAVSSYILKTYYTKQQHVKGHTTTLCGDIPHDFVSSLLYDISKYFLIVIDDKDAVVGFSIFTLNDKHIFMDLLCSIGYGKRLLQYVEDTSKRFYPIGIVKLVSLPSSLSFYLNKGYTYSTGLYYVKSLTTNDERLKTLSPIEVLYYLSNTNFKIYAYDSYDPNLRDEEYLMEKRLG